MKQIDIFGGEAEIVVPSRKTPTMQEMFGVTPDKQCRTCVHCYARRQSRVWYKCDIWDGYFRGCSEASDIHLKDQACGRYMVKGNRQSQTFYGEEQEKAIEAWNRRAGDDL